MVEVVVESGSLKPGGHQSAAMTHKCSFIDLLNCKILKEEKTKVLSCEQKQPTYSEKAEKRALRLGVKHYGTGRAAQPQAQLTLPQHPCLMV
jgi:hypothetical protein